MAVAGLPLSVPALPLPVAQITQGMPVTAYNQQVVQQPVFRPPGYFGPVYQPQPQGPPRPFGQARQNPFGHWNSSQSAQRATGNPDIKQLKRKNRQKTARAFGQVTGNPANSQAGNQQKRQTKSFTKQNPAFLGVRQQSAFKQPRKPGQNFRQGFRGKQRRGPFQKQRTALPVRAQTPATILRTPATIQPSPAAVQHTPAFIVPDTGDHNLQSAGLESGRRRRRRLTDDLELPPSGAELDFFGTNQGLIMRRNASDSAESSGSGAEDSDSDSEAENDCELQLKGTSTAGLPRHVQAHIDDQTDHITQLEVDNARLSDENINLKERLFVLEKEMAELRRAGPATTEDEAPQPWFAMAESDFDDENHEHDAAHAKQNVESHECAAGQHLSPPASFENATPSSRAPTMMDAQ